MATDPRLELLDPEFARRNEALVEYGWSRGWHIEYTRWLADYDTQKALRVAYVTGKRSIEAADPDAQGPRCPEVLGDWFVRGSMHQLQADGRFHALDYSIEGCTWTEFHTAARMFGIGFPLTHEESPWRKSQGLTDEVWHAQAWRAGGEYYPAPLLPAKRKDDDMVLLIQPDDGDPAVFLTDGVIKTWVRDGNAVQEAQRLGLAKAALDGTPIQVSRGLVSSLALVGGPPIYAADYHGPRTTI